MQSAISCDALYSGWTLVRAGAMPCDEVSLAARSPVAGQISLGGTAAPALPGRPPGLRSICRSSKLRRLGRMLATRATSSRSRRRLRGARRRWSGRTGLAVLNYAARIIGAPRVITSVCSQWAARLPSRVRMVQPSSSWTGNEEPALIIGSIVRTRPSVRTSRRNRS